MPRIPSIRIDNQLGYIFVTPGAEPIVVNGRWAISPGTRARFTQARGAADWKMDMTFALGEDGKRVPRDLRGELYRVEGSATGRFELARAERIGRWLDQEIGLPPEPVLAVDYEVRTSDGMAALAFMFDGARWLDGAVKGAMTGRWSSKDPHWEDPHRMFGHDYPKQKRYVGKGVFEDDAGNRYRYDGFGGREYLPLAEWYTFERDRFLDQEIGV